MEDLEKFYNSLIPFSLLIVCEGSQSLTRFVFPSLSFPLEKVFVISLFFLSLFLFLLTFFRELFVRKGAVKVEHLTSKKTTLAVHGSEDKVFLNLLPHPSCLCL